MNDAFCMCFLYFYTKLGMGSTNDFFATVILEVGERIKGRHALAYQFYRQKATQYSICTSMSLGYNYYALSERGH